MSISTDAGHFFQSSAAQASATRKAAKAQNNTAGNPIKLDSKILAVLADPTDDERRRVFVAESAGLVRRIRVPYAEGSEKGKDVDLKHTYRGPTTPLTSLALSTDNTTLFASSWDKSIWSWDVHTRKPLRRYQGHTDFIKAVLCVSLSSPSNSSTPTEILISGSADNTVILWSVNSGEKLAVVRETGRILSLAVDPCSFRFPNPFTATPNGGGLKLGKPAANPPGSFVLYTASSDPEVRRWRVSATDSTTDGTTESTTNTSEGKTGGISITELSPPKELTHDTSINALFFTPQLDRWPSHASDLPSDELEEEGSKLWTASSDNSARSFSMSPDAVAGAGNGEDVTAYPWRQELRLEHPDFVRDVVVDEGRGVVVTACRDEEVRVWDAAEGALVHVWRGHFEEVMGLALVGGRGGVGGFEGTGKGKGKEVVSVGIDGTVRCWSLDGGVMGEARGREEKSGEVVGTGEEEGGKGVEMTEEEERELRELMDEDD